MVFDSLFREHSTYVLNLMRHLVGPGRDAEDLAQEVFVIAMRKLDQGFEVIAPRAWLEAIAVRVASHARRTRWFRGQFGVVDQMDEQIDWRTPQQSLEDKESSRLLHGMLDRLGKKKRTVFILYEIMGKTAPEIAATLKCSVNTVYTQLRRAREEMFAMRRSADPGVVE